MSRLIPVAALLALATTLALGAEPPAREAAVPGHHPRRERRRHDHEAADPNRLALPPPRSSCRGRRRPAGRRCRRTLELPTPGTAYEVLRPPECRGDQAYRPDLVVVHSESGVYELERLGIDNQLPAAQPRRIPAGQPARARHRPREARRRCRQAHAYADQCFGPAGPAPGANAVRLSRAHDRLLLGHLADIYRAGLPAFGLRNIADAADRPTTRSSPASTSSLRTPT